MKDGGRVEVLLHRGYADEWVLGTVRDCREMKVELDEDPPGLPRMISEPDICDWRPAGD
jgi:hypothetical protein